MSTNFEKISSNKVKLTFVVPAEDFDKALNQAYLKDRSKINVPGFRKGKAPRAVIERMYGEGVFYDDALDAIFPALYAEAIKEHNVDVAGGCAGNRRGQGTEVHRGSFRASGRDAGRIQESDG